MDNDTKNIIDALRNNDLESARDETQRVLYQKSAENMSLKRLDISSQLGQNTATEQETEKDE